MKSLFIALLTLSSFAQDPSCYEPHAHDHFHGFSSDIDSITGKIFTCEESKYFSDAKNEFDKLFPNKSVQKRNIAGINVSGPKALLDVTESILSNADKDKNFTPTWFKEKAKSCKTAICLLEATFKDKEAAMRAASITKKTGYTVSASQSNGPFQKGDEYIWSKEDLRKLGTAMEMMPKELIGLKGLKKMYALPEGYTLEAGTLAWAKPSYETKYSKNQGSITFTHRSLNRSIDDTFHTIVHETAHHHDFMAIGTDLKGKKLSEKDPYYKLNNWKLTKGKKKIGSISIDTDIWTRDSKGCSVTEYGKTDPTEEYAEMISWYILFPEQIKKQCPKHFSYFKKNVFNGKEFTNPFKVNIASTDKCISSKPGFSLYTNKEHLLMSSIETNNVRLSRIPNIIIDDKCISELVADAVDHTDTYSNKDLCYRGGMESLKKLAKSDSSKQVEKYTSMLIDGVKKVDWQKVEDKCIQEKSITDSCYSSEATKQLAQLSGIKPEVLKDSMQVKPVVNAKVAKAVFGGTGIITCLTEVFSFKKEPLKEMWDTKSSVYCGKGIRESLKSNKRYAGDQYTEYSLVDQYYKSPNVKADAHKMVDLLTDAFKSKKCKKKFFKKKECRLEEIKKAIENNAQSFDIDMNQVNDSVINEIEKLFASQLK